jgi:AcrR family transcriptional regulator
MKESDNVTLRDRQKSETRTQIQSTARALIIELGYEKTTMRALAKAAGVGLGTISLHFKDKKSLLLASFFDEIESVAQGALESVPRNEHVREQLLYIFREVYGYYAMHTDFLRTVIKEALFIRGEWGAVFDRQIGGYICLMGELIEAGKERGEVKPEINGEHVATICWGLYINGLLEGFKQDRFDSDAQVARIEPLLDIVLGGVLV